MTLPVKLSTVKELPKKAALRGKEGILEYQLAVVKQMAQLATAGLGLVAALAWNELIRNLIDTYIKPKLGIGSGIISLVIYAIIITLLAVFVTLQLSKIVNRLEEQTNRLSPSKDK